tara:strand:- start:2515 stop:3135 length:621 start_codon:yes stop_codon:yes gene_type:complete
MVEYILPLTRHLLAGNSKKLETFMAERGFARVQVVPSPLHTLLPCAKLRYTYHYWETLRSHETLPSRKQIDPRRLGIALGNICLLEAVNLGRDMKYRLYGSNIAYHAGHDLQGMTLREIPRHFPRKDFSDLPFHLALFQACLIEKRPYFSEYMTTSAQRRTPRIWSRLSLPLTNNRGEVTMILHCISPRPTEQPAARVPSDMKMVV